jgi:hypothetical protein
MLRAACDTGRIEVVIFGQATSRGSGLDMLRQLRAGAFAPEVKPGLREAFSTKGMQQKLAITDALNRLDAAGLIERRGGKAIASGVATYFDQIMTL